MISVIFIVNGVDFRVDVDPDDWVSVGRNQALGVSNNTGRPADEWEVHNGAGLPVDAELSFGEQGVKDGDRLFLNLGVGAGGSSQESAQ